MTKIFFSFSCKSYCKPQCSVVYFFFSCLAFPTLFEYLLSLCFRRFFWRSFPWHLERNWCCHQSFSGARSDCWKHGGLLQWDFHPKVFSSFLHWHFLLVVLLTVGLIFKIPSNPLLLLLFCFLQPPSAPKWYLSLPPFFCVQLVSI